MLENIKIKSFKALKDEDIEFRSLTVLCGENSSGKSTAVMLCLLAGSIGNIELLNYISGRISQDQVNGLNGSYKLKNTENAYLEDIKTNIFKGMERDAYDLDYSFLCADRIAPVSLHNTNAIDRDSDNIGIHGEYATYILDRDNYNEIDARLIKYTEVKNFGAQVGYWLRYILDTDVKTEKVGDKIEIRFRHAKDEEFYKPENTGFGTSLLFPIIIACLKANIGKTIIIENPEIHLHPKAQAKLGDFFAFIASRGIQIILETHCEHLIYKLCYNVNKGELKKEDLIFQYKERNKPFSPIYVDDRGRFVDKESSLKGFPKGFFDSTLMDTIHIYNR